jgi:sulfite exporter TauE/SafE
MGHAAWLAALLLGLAGGAHCAGMCGPIVGALSLSAGARKRPAAFGFAYHVGRAASYASAGAIAGAFGEAGLAMRGSLAVQQALFGLASTALLASGLYVAGYAPFVRRIEAVGSVVWRALEPWSRPLGPATTLVKASALGMLWGWLPCAMVYGALLIALGTGSARSGAMTMAAFALGTLPSLIAVGIGARSAARLPARRALRLAAGLAIALVGAYGVLRLGLHFAALSGLCTVPQALVD